LKGCHSELVEESLSEPLAVRQRYQMAGTPERDSSTSSE
jgi:hypothetical protein